jgi:hypothetical protein
MTYEGYASKNINHGNYEAREIKPSNLRDHQAENIAAFNLKGSICVCATLFNCSVAAESVPRISGLIKTRSCQVLRRTDLPLKERRVGLLVQNSDFEPMCSGISCSIVV